MAGRMISGAAALAELVRPAGEHDAPGVHRVLPVVPELSGLLPGRGLRRGSTVAVAAGRSAPAGGSTSLLLALLAEASRSGSWCAVVGIPSLGALAAQESGIDLDRLALVPDPGPDWPTVIAALIDGVDVVVTAIPGQVAPTIADRLVARARQRGSVLMPFGPWPGADVTLQVTASRWEGLSLGRGRLRRREVTILARGRGAAARPKEITLWMPGLTHRPPSLPPTTGQSPPTPDSFQPTPAETPPRGLRAVSPASVPPAADPAFRALARSVRFSPGGLRAVVDRPAADPALRLLARPAGHPASAEPPRRRPAGDGGGPSRRVWTAAKQRQSPPATDWGATGHPIATPTSRPAGVARPEHLAMALTPTAERSSPVLPHPVRRLLSLVRSAHRVGRSLRYSAGPVLSGQQAGRSLRSLPLDAAGPFQSFASALDVTGPFRSFASALDVAGPFRPDTAQRGSAATGQITLAGMSGADPDTTQQAITATGRAAVAG